MTYRKSKQTRLDLLLQTSNVILHVIRLQPLLEPKLDFGEGVMRRDRERLLAARMDIGELAKSNAEDQASWRFKYEAMQLTNLADLETDGAQERLGARVPAHCKGLADHIVFAIYLLKDGEVAFDSCQPGVIGTK